MAFRTPCVQESRGFPDVFYTLVFYCDFAPPPGYFKIYLADLTPLPSNTVSELYKQCVENKDEMTPCMFNGY